MNEQNVFAKGIGGQFGADGNERFLEDLEDYSDTPTLKREAIPRQTPVPFVAEEVLEAEWETPDNTSFPEVDLESAWLPQPSLKRVNLNRFPNTLTASSPYGEVSSAPEQSLSPQFAETVSGANPYGQRSTSIPAFSPPLWKNAGRNSMVVFLLLLLAIGAVGMVYFSKQNASPLIGPSSGSSKLLFGLCIVLAIAFTVGFNILSRVSLSTTRYEYAYTTLWQLSCALLVPFFLPFDRFSISLNPHVLLLFGISIVLWALVDAFMFTSFKYEEASVLSSIFPLNYVFTFVVTIVFLHSAIKPTIVVGFLIIMAATLLIGLRSTRLRLSKGILFALLYSLFQGAALGFNSAVVKSFSIPPYMLAAFLFPALANMFVFLRPKVSQLRYEWRVQWKKILLNAAVMDISFFFLLKAFELGNVPQVVALSASSTLLTALAGIVILKEDTHIALKIMAATLATLGIILVQL